MLVSDTCVYADKEEEKKLKGVAVEAIITKSNKKQADTIAKLILAGVALYLLYSTLKETEKA